MKPPTARLWIAKGRLEELLALADASYPRETGGVLLGFEGDNAIAITALTGPGARAMHAHNSFVPDYEYQDAEIARVYADSGRRYTYLGDWHSHPDGGSALSRKDKQTLRTISTHSPARAPTPIMGILSGGAPWKLTVWEYVPLFSSLRMFGQYRTVPAVTYDEMPDTE